MDKVKERVVCWNLGVRSGGEGIEEMIHSEFRYPKSRPFSQPYIQTASIAHVFPSTLFNSQFPLYFCFAFYIAYRQWQLPVWPGGGWPLGSSFLHLSHHFSGDL